MRLTKLGVIVAVAVALGGFAPARVPTAEIGPSSWGLASLVPNHVIMLAGLPFIAPSELVRLDSTHCTRLLPAGDSGTPLRLR